MAVNGAERRFRYEIACFRLVPKPAVRAIDINPHSPDKAAISGGSAREADQVRREGRQPRPLRHVPNDRGWGATTDGRGNPEPYRVFRRLQLLRGWSHDEASSPIFP